MLQTIARAVVLLCWLAWTLAFIVALKKSTKQTKVVRAPVSKWGIVLQVLGIAIVCPGIRPRGYEKSAASLIVSMILAPLAVWLGWSAVRHLGRHWRYEAALIENHELIQTGPYRLIRHPIYASMMLVLLAVGAAWTWWPMLAAGLGVFLVGTEIRVRAEDRLLAERFGEAFASYRSRVRAFVPFIR